MMSGSYSDSLSFGEVSVEILPALEDNYMYLIRWD